jgi:predicted deacylase
MKNPASNKAITIAGTVVAPGQRYNINLPVGELYTAAPLFMPVHVVRGSAAGPTLFVSAAIHGDELNGIEIIRRVLKRNILRSIRGTLLAVPIVNVYGFLNQSRYLPDRRDLNRSFPGSPKGSIAARLANTFNKHILANSDYGIDLHTGAFNRCNLPQIRGNLDDQQTLELARSFGVPVIINANIRDGSLRSCAAERGMPVLIYEAGECLRFDEISIRAGVRGVLNVMRSIGMLPRSRGRSGPIKPVLAQSTVWVRASVSGIVRDKVKLGSAVTEGQRLATISDPLGTQEESAVAPCDGIVIGCSNLPLTHEGDALFNVAAFRSTSRAEGLIDEFSATYSDISFKD